MIPAVIQDLDLDLALTTYCRQIDNYILTSNSNEHIVDLEVQKISAFVTPMIGQVEEHSGKVFNVKNPMNKDFALLQIDHGIINTTATKKCDCAIIDSVDCSFIEFKTNATSIKTSTVKANYQKAQKQLSTTIDIFRDGIKSVGKDLDTLRNIEAHICFRKGYPRQTASEGTYRVKFATANRCALYFDSEKTLM